MIRRRRRTIESTKWAISSQPGVFHILYIISVIIYFGELLNRNGSKRRNYCHAKLCHRSFAVCCQKLEFIWHSVAHEVHSKHTEHTHTDTYNAFMLIIRINCEQRQSRNNWYNANRNSHYHQAQAHIQRAPLFIRKELFHYYYIYCYPCCYYYYYFVCIVCDYIII